MVGGGLVGSAVGYELACAGAEVVLVDSGDPGRASDAGAGIVSPQTWRDPDDSWWRFGCDAAAHLSDLVERLAGDGADAGPATFARRGSLVVALAEHEDPWFEEAASVIRGRSPGVEEVDPPRARAKFPPLGRVWRSLYNPDAARVDGRRLTRALRDAGASRGVLIRHARVRGLVRAGGRVTAVRVDDGLLGCDAVVLAAGAWSGSFGDELGLALPVRPMKGQIAHVTSVEHIDTDHWPIVQPILNFYLVPWAGGRVACGGTFEADAGFDERPTASGLRDLLRECVAIAPGLAAATFTEVRVGFRPASADERPLLGPVPGWSNVHVCTGHGAEGLLLGAYSGALVATAVLGGPSDVLAPFLPDRFV